MRWREFSWLYHWRKKESETDTATFWCGKFLVWNVKKSSLYSLTKSIFVVGVCKILKISRYWGIMDYTLFICFNMIDNELLYENWEFLSLRTTNIKIEMNKWNTEMYLFICIFIILYLTENWEMIKLALSFIYFLKIKVNFITAQLMYRLKKNENVFKLLISGNSTVQYSSKCLKLNRIWQQRQRKLGKRGGMGTVTVS